MGDRLSANNLAATVSCVPEATAAVHHRLALPHRVPAAACLVAAMCQTGDGKEECCVSGTECKRSEGAYSVCCAPDKSKATRPGYQWPKAFSIGLQLLLFGLPTPIRLAASPASRGQSSNTVHTMACPTPPICRGVHIRVLRCRRQVLQGCRWQGRLLRDRWVCLAAKEVCLRVLRCYLTPSCKTGTCQVGSSQITCSASLCLILLTQTCTWQGSSCAATTAVLSAATILAPAAASTAREAQAVSDCRCLLSTSVQPKECGWEHNLSLCLTPDLLHFQKNCRAVRKAMLPQRQRPVLQGRRCQWHQCVLPGWQ